MAKIIPGNFTIFITGGSATDGGDANIDRYAANSAHDLDDGLLKDGTDYTELVLSTFGNEIDLSFEIVGGPPPDPQRGSGSRSVAASQVTIDVEGCSHLWALSPDVLPIEIPPGTHYLQLRATAFGRDQEMADEAGLPDQRSAAYRLEIWVTTKAEPPQTLLRDGGTWTQFPNI